MRVSVVLPALNEEHNIGKCLTRIKEQDPFEIIVIDHSSTDRTVEIASQYTDKIRTMPRSTKVGTLRQIGAEMAEGEIIVTTDADARVTPDWLEKIEAKFINDPDLVAVYGCHYDEGSNILKNIEMDFICMVCGISGNTAFRRDAFYKSKGYPPTDTYYDCRFFRNIGEVGKTEYDKDIAIEMNLDEKHTALPMVCLIFGSILIWALRQ